MKGKAIKDTHIYLPEPLHAELASLADEHTRSLNGEIVAALKAWMTCQKRQQQPS